MKKHLSILATTAVVVVGLAGLAAAKDVGTKDNGLKLSVSGSLNYEVKYNVLDKVFKNVNTDDNMADQTQSWERTFQIVIDQKVGDANLKIIKDLMIDNGASSNEWDPTLKSTISGKASGFDVALGWVDVNYDNFILNGTAGVGGNFTKKVGPFTFQAGSTYNKFVIGVDDQRPSVKINATAAKASLDLGNGSNVFGAMAIANAPTVYEERNVAAGGTYKLGSLGEVTGKYAAELGDDVNYTYRAVATLYPVAGLTVKGDINYTDEDLYFPFMDWGNNWKNMDGDADWDSVWWRRNFYPSQNYRLTGTYDLIKDKASVTADFFKYTNMKDVQAWNGTSRNRWNGANAATAAEGSLITLKAKYTPAFLDEAFVAISDDKNVGNEFGAKFVYYAPADLTLTGQLKVKTFAADAAESVTFEENTQQYALIQVDKKWNGWLTTSAGLEKMYPFGAEPKSQVHPWVMVKAGLSF